MRNEETDMGGERTSGAATRREALRRGILGAAGLALGGRGAPPARAAVGPARAKAVIQIWMWGGPSHLDTFDPKPEAGYDYCGTLNEPIETNVKGIRIGQLLPLLAQQADKYSIIRSMTHGVNAHETASYIVQTGHLPGRLVYPCIGAVVSQFKGYEHGYKGLVPPYIVLTQPQGRFSEAGFLGQRYKPFATGGDPNREPFAVEGIVAQGISDERQRARRELLHQLDSLGRAMPADPVFQSCLVARRLIEHGVPYVTINYKGWDTHKQHFETIRRKLPEMDRGMATLLEDLADRGLLDTTIVWWSGEFGRTPRVLWNPPWNGGRGHYGKCFSAVVAGGGFKGGHVVGASDATGENVVGRPAERRPAERRSAAGDYVSRGVRR